MPHTPAHSHSPAGAITHVAGIEVGHFTDTRRPTGCTVILTRDGAIGAITGNLIQVKV